MKSSQEEQRKIRKPSQLNNAKQKKKKKENNRMRKTRDLFKKIRDTKGIFHVEMGTLKERNSIDITEAEDITR